LIQGEVQVQLKKKKIFSRDCCEEPELGTTCLRNAGGDTIALLYLMALLLYHGSHNNP
jgi:hypothetical protein